MNAAKQPDATLDSLERLNDTSRWVIVRGVPIFSPHTRYNREGEALYEIGTDELKDIAEQCNRLESEVGVPVKISIGHTMQVPEMQQSPVVGYARNLRVGTFGPKKLPALIADFFYAKDCWETARKYPFRSAEYYPSSKQISGVALLERDPELDLGALIFERGLEAITDGRKNKVFFYSRNWGDPMPDVVHYEGEPEGKKMQGSSEGAPQKPGEGLELDPEFERHADAYHAKKFPMFTHMHAHYASHHATQHAAEAATHHAAAASGTNTAMPAPVGHPNAPVPPPTMPAAPPAAAQGSEHGHPLPPHESVHHQRSEDPETTRMQTVQTDIRMAQYQRENEEMRARLERLEKDNATAQRESRLAKYERDLTGLLGQGFHFELVEEMKDVADLTPEQFSRHCERIKKNYQKGPVGGTMLRPYPGKVESSASAKEGEIPEYYQGDTEDFENPAYEEVLAHMRLTPGMSYEKALEEVQQKKKVKKTA